MASITQNTLFYGDNLAILREHIDAESVDLVYLDPPFNSNRSYNVLFKDESGREAEAQITAFEDAWHWNATAEATYHELVTHSGNERISRMISALRDFIGANQMMAYLVMMAARLQELHRVLKPTGSLYLHCDPVASHYLKIVMDTIFGIENFKNEVVWMRTIAKALSTRRLPNNHDIILRYQKTNVATWHEDAMFQPYDPSDLDEKTTSKYRYQDTDGRIYRLDNLINPNPNRPNLTYEFLGVTKVWRWTKDRMQTAYEAGLVVQTAPGRVPQLKRYLEQQRGKPLGDVWTDINPINSQAQERLGYPTQKPLALLERIINASSNPGDVVLDPFCVTGDTLIVTDKGLKPICQVEIGDSVLTHTGRYRKVTRLYERQYQGELLTLKRARSNIGIHITPNHPVLAVRAKMCPYDSRRCLPRICHYHRHNRHLDCPHYRDNYSLEWIPAGKLREGDFVFYPLTHVETPEYLELPLNKHFNAKPLPATLPLTSAVMEWFGYFAAEGFVDSNSVHFANYEDAEHIAELGAMLFGLTSTITTRPYRSKHVRFNSRALSRWLEVLIGRGAANKRLPEWVLSVDQQCRHGLLRSLLRSDGSFRRDKANDNSHSYRYGSASPTLSHQIMRLLLTEGIAGTFEIRHPSQQNRNINGRPIQVNHPSYRVAIYDAVGVNQLLQATVEAPTYTERIIRQQYDSYPFGDGWLYTLKTIEKEQANVKVYNLEVEDVHSYVTTTFTVHNCGCGTTIAAAQKLGRRWIGIDITHLSIALQKYRLKDAFGLVEKQDYAVKGEPEDWSSARQLAQEDAYQFQWWALSLIKARPLGGDGGKQGKKGSDKGIDGVIVFIDDASSKAKRVLVQVKSGKVKSGDIRDLRGVIEREQAAIGVFITLNEPSKDMQAEAVAAGFYHSPGWNRNYPRLQILSIVDLFAGEEVKMPPASVTFKEAPKEQTKSAMQQGTLLDMEGQ